MRMVLPMASVILTLTGLCSVVCIMIAVLSVVGLGATRTANVSDNFILRPEAKHDSTDIKPPLLTVSGQ